MRRKLQKSLLLARQSQHNGCNWGGGAHNILGNMPWHFMMAFYNVRKQHFDYFHDVIFSVLVREEWLGGGGRWYRSWMGKSGYEVSVHDI